MKGRKMCRSLASFGSGEEMKLHFTINKGKKWFSQRLESRIIMMLTSGYLCLYHEDPKPFFTDHPKTAATMA